MIYHGSDDAGHVAQCILQLSIVLSARAAQSRRHCDPHQGLNRSGFLSSCVFPEQCHGHTYISLALIYHPCFGGAIDTVWDTADTNAKASTEGLHHPFNG
jgi:hypothetical protein